MTMEQKFNALADYILAEDPEAKETAKKALAATMKPGAVAEPSQDYEMAVHQFLLDLGAPSNLNGYKYAVYGICQAILHPEYVDSMVCKFYPMISIRFDTTASRVERAIRNLVETIWIRCNYDVLNKYFQNSIDSNKGKPTNSLFIAQSALIVKSRLNH